MRYGNPLYEAILDDRLGVNEGMLTENVVAQAFKATRGELFYYARSGDGGRDGRMEVDFLIGRNGKTVPVEVILNIPNLDNIRHFNVSVAFRRRGLEKCTWEISDARFVEYDPSRLLWLDIRLDF